MKRFVETRLTQDEVEDVMFAVNFYIRLAGDFGHATPDYENIFRKFERLTNGFDYVPRQRVSKKPTVFEVQRKARRLAKLLRNKSKSKK